MTVKVSGCSRCLPDSVISSFLSKYEAGWRGVSIKRLTGCPSTPVWTTDYCTYKYFKNFREWNSNLNSIILKMLHVFLTGTLLTALSPFLYPLCCSSSHLKYHGVVVRKMRTKELEKVGTSFCSFFFLVSLWIIFTVEVWSGKLLKKVIWSWGWFICQEKTQYSWDRRSPRLPQLCLNGRWCMNGCPGTLSCSWEVDMPWLLAVR